MKNLMKTFLASFALMAAMLVLPSVADAAVTGLRQTEASTSSVDITWDADPTADYYKVYWSADGMTWSKAATSYSPKDYLYGLSSGKTYLIRVTSVSSKGMESSPSTLEVVTVPNSEDMGKIVVSGITENSMSFAWVPAVGATGYVIADNDTKAVIGTTTTPNYTLTGLSPATWYSIDIYPVRVSSTTGYTAMGNYNYQHTYNKTMDSLVAPGGSGATGSVNSTGVRISAATPSTGAVTFSATTYSGVLGSGLEVQICNMKGKTVKTVRSIGTSVSTKVKKNTPYKYRARYYYTDATGKRVYGAYTGFRYFWNQTATGKRITSLSSSRFKASWGKVAGAKGYKVYISNSRTSGFKLAKKLGKKAKSTTITKYGKSRLNRFSTYYVKIIAQVKSGKKTVSNDAQYVYYR